MSADDIGPAARRHCEGFTLVEVLVAMATLALITALAWRGVDGLVASREGSGAVLERTMRLDTAMAQWEQDLAGVRDTGVVPALAFDGQQLVLTRDAGGGVQLVVWRLDGQAWRRWASPSVTTVGALQEHWLRLPQVMLGESPPLAVLEDVSGWQVYFYRGNAWTNAQSTGDVAEAPEPGASAPPGAPRERLPDGVRLMLDLGELGALTRDLQLALGGGA